MKIQKTENTIRHIVNKNSRKASVVWIEEDIDEDNLWYAEVILHGSVNEKESGKIENEIKRAVCKSMIDWNICVR